jgi:predicted alpha/beta superfamily hydrolase
VKDPWAHRAFGYSQPARGLQIAGWGHEHEVRVWLPPSYEHSDRRFSTLWVTDNALEIAVAALNGCSIGDAPELIVVAIGGPTGTSSLEFQRRRTYDFLPEHHRLSPEGRTHLATAGAVGGAAGFRDHLIDEPRPQLAAEYRMDPDDNGLAGHSAAGEFGLFTLFTRPEGFRKYLIGSPSGTTDLVVTKRSTRPRPPTWTPVCSSPLAEAR